MLKVEIRLNKKKDLLKLVAIKTLPTYIKIYTLKRSLS